MSDEKDLFEEEEEEELLKNESSAVGEEEMTEEKHVVEKSDRCELMISYNTSCTVVTIIEMHLTLHINGQSCAQSQYTRASIPSMLY